MRRSNDDDAVPAAEKGVDAAGMQPDDRATFERRFFWLIVGAGTFFLFMLARPLFRGCIYAYGDLINYSLPLRRFYARCLATGENFNWMPDLHNGFYLQGEGQIGLYHPLHLFLYAVFPLGAAFNLELLLNYVALLFGTYFFLRRWDLPRYAAAFGAVTFAFSGYNMTHFIHINCVTIIAHMPWLLLAIDVAMRGTKPVAVATARMAIALLTASQLLLGHPQHVWLSSLAELGYVVFLSMPHFSLQRLAWVGVAKLLGVVSSAIQLIPTLETVARSTRCDALTQLLNENSLHPLNLLQWLNPYVFGIDRLFWAQLGPQGHMRLMAGNEELAIYCGSVVVLLSVLAVFNYRTLGPRRPLAIAAAILAVFALILSFGYYGYLYRLQALLPAIGMFRCPVRYMVLTHFALAVLSAIALAECFPSDRRQPRLPWNGLWPIPLAAALSLLLLLLAAGVRNGIIRLPDAVDPATSLAYTGWPQAADVGTFQETLLGTLLVVAAAAILLIAVRRGRYAALLLVAFCFVDQACYTAQWVWRMPQATLQQLRDDARPPPEATNRRIMYFPMDYDRPLLRDVKMAFGYISLPPRLQLEKAPAAYLALSDVAYFLNFDGKTASWVRLTGSMPRARLVCDARLTPDLPADILRIDLATTALAFSPIDLPPGTPGTAAVTRDRPGDIEIATDCETRQLLVLSESHHPGWTVAVDGKTTPVLQLYGDFLGCVVEPGRHTVDFLFRPRSLQIGVCWTLAGLAATIAMFLASLMMAKRAQRLSTVPE